MRTNEECYEYVIKRVGELEAQKRKRHEIALKAAAPVCGIAVIAGATAALRIGKPNTKTDIVSDTDLTYSETVSSMHSQENSALESTPKYENTLNIGEVVMVEYDVFHLYDIPGLYEMSRDEVLAHFGLGTKFDLSEVIDELHETAPRNTCLNPDGKHGFCRFYTVDENGNGSWEELLPHFENDEFVFESEDGSKTAVVIFDGEERVNWLRSGILSYEGNGMYSTEPFYSLPTSTVASVEMQIAKRSIGGYYAEFRTETLSVGLIAEGLSEDETVAILEYLAKYTGVADNATENDLSISDIAVSYPDVIN